MSMGAFPVPCCRCSLLREYLGVRSAEVDDIVKHMHRVEMNHIVSAPAIARNVNLAHRRKVVAWLVKVFHVVPPAIGSIALNAEEKVCQPDLVRKHVFSTLLTELAPASVWTADETAQPLFGAPGAGSAPLSIRVSRPRGQLRRQHPLRHRAPRRRVRRTPATVVSHYTQEKRSSGTCHTGLLA